MAVKFNHIAEAAAYRVALKSRLQAVAESLDRVKKRGRSAAARAAAPTDHPGLESTAVLKLDIERIYA